MKTIITTLAFFVSVLTFSQVGIGTNTPSSKSILDLTATDKGFLLPRMTTAQRTAISPSAITDKGMQVFDTTTNSIWYWDGTTWIAQGSKNIYDTNGTIGAGRTVALTDNINFDSNTFFINGANNRIGMGTNSPTESLEVRGNILSKHPSGSVSQILVNGTQAQVEIYDLFAHKYNIRTGAVYTTSGGSYLSGFEINDGGTTPRFYIWSNGSVVVGQPAAPPTQKLEVIGNAKLTTLPSVAGANIDKIVTVATDGTLGSIASTIDKTADAFVNNTANTRVELSTNADGTTARTAGTEFVIKDTGNVGIGTNSPNAYAKLDVTSSNQGVLVPRVNLTSATFDLNSDGDGNVSNQPNGLLIYNTGSTYSHGFYFWNGSEWKLLSNNSLIPPSITSLDCAKAVANPLTFTNGVAYTGTVTVPYAGGNGINYNGAAAFSQNGLNFTLQSGTLAYGNGSITYNVTGTPNFSSPSTIIVPITFLGQSCSVNIGGTTVVKQLQYATNTFDYNNFNFLTISETTLGELSFRLNENPFISGDRRIEFRFTTARSGLIMTTQKQGGGGNFFAAQHRTMSPAANTWFSMNIGDSFPNIVNNDVVTTEIFDTQNGKIYRVKSTFRNLTGSTGKGSVFIELLE